MKATKALSHPADTNKTPGVKKNSDDANPAVDPNTTTAAEQAAADISTDPDLTPDESKTADLDEGELARADNSND